MSARGGSRTDPLQRLRDHYAHQVSNNVASLVENFGGLLASAHINEKSDNARENFQIEVYTTTMVKSSESLLKMVAELKHSMILNDFKAIQEEAQAKEASYTELVETTNNHIQDFKLHLIAALHELEDAYCSSKYNNLANIKLNQSYY